MKWIGSVVLALIASALQAMPLDLHGLTPQSVALYAAEVGGAEPLAVWRDGEPVNPASTMKVLTGWAALERLGPDYRWQTGLASNAPLENGVLRGDLYWIGRGDPHFYLDALRELIVRLRERGVRKIDGRLVLDHSWFNRIADAAGFDEDQGKPFASRPDTHLTHLNVAWLTFMNDAAGPRVVMEPALPSLPLQVHLSSTDSGECRDVRQHVSIRREVSAIRIEGTLPKACDGAKSFLEVMEPDVFAAASFTALWHEAGGEGALPVASGITPAGARTLATLDSEPLSRVLPDILKFSSNPMARLLFLTVGRQTPLDGDVVAGAEHSIRTLLASHGIDASPLVLENGSGLSRRERVSARMLGQVLETALKGAWGPELAASLPVAGGEGTLKRRLADYGGRLRLKTGTLKDVRALAGYWQEPDGRRLVIVLQVANAVPGKAAPAMDAIVEDLVRRFQATPKRISAGIMH